MLDWEKAVRRFESSSRGTKQLFSFGKANENSSPAWGGRVKARKPLKAAVVCLCVCLCLCVCVSVCPCVCICVTALSGSVRTSLSNIQFKICNLLNLRRSLGNAKSRISVCIKFIAGNLKERPGNVPLQLAMLKSEVAILNKCRVVKNTQVF